jgi:hypothetical protein
VVEVWAYRVLGVGVVGGVQQVAEVLGADEHVQGHHTVEEVVEVLEPQPVRVVARLAVMTRRRAQRESKDMWLVIRSCTT